MFQRLGYGWTGEIRWTPRRLLHSSSLHSTAPYLSLSLSGSMARVETTEIQLKRELTPSENDRVNVVSSCSMLRPRLRTRIFLIGTEIWNGFASPFPSSCVETRSMSRFVGRCSGHYPFVRHSSTIESTGAKSKDWSSHFPSKEELVRLFLLVSSLSLLLALHRLTLPCAIDNTLRYAWLLGQSTDVSGH